MTVKQEDVKDTYAYSNPPAYSPDASAPPLVIAESIEPVANYVTPPINKPVRPTITTTYITTTPPPKINTPQPINQAPPPQINTRPPINPNMPNLGSRPVFMQCPICNEQMTTQTSMEIDVGTVIAIFVILALFWPAFWIPLVCPCCKRTIHTCSKCHRNIGYQAPCP